MTRAPTILVAGAGAVGSTVAFVLAEAGFEVVVADPVPPGENASGVAAGMLAPAFESLFDEPKVERFALLAKARDAWSPLAERVGLPLDRSGALAVGDEGEVEAWAAGLAALGAAHGVLAPAATEALAPGLRPGLAAVFSEEDWRLDPGGALAGLRQAAEGRGARFVRASLTGYAAGDAAIDGGAVSADLVVLATGASRDLQGLAPELGAVGPVKGHILRTTASWPARCVIRRPGLYLCPTADGTILGATMEAGVGGADVDKQVAQKLLQRAEAFAPGVAGLGWGARAGVRGTTPDGLPLVGFSRTPAVTLAVGARRNGWLLAPMIAEQVLRLCRGEAALALFDPARFP